MIEIDGIGPFEPHDSRLMIARDVINVPTLGIRCRFMLADYERDPDPAAFHEAMRQFIAMGPEVLAEASQHVFAYYTDIIESGGDEPPEIPSADQVWKYVDFGSDAVVSRRGYGGDDRIYISLECACDWEREHGLQIVFRNGNFINKVGPFDGHVSNADTFDDPALESTIYAG